MPLQTDIPLQYRPPQQADPLQSLVRLAQLEGLHQQRELNSYKVLEAQQEQQDSRAIKDVIAQFKDQDLSDSAVQTRMLGAVGSASPTAYFKLSKQFGEQNKTLAEAKRAALEARYKNLEILHKLSETDSPATHAFNAALTRQLFPDQAHLVPDEFDPDPAKRLTFQDQLKLHMKGLEAEIQGKKEVAVKRETLALEQPEKDRQYALERDKLKETDRAHNLTRQSAIEANQATLGAAERQAQGQIRAAEIGRTEKPLEGTAAEAVAQLDTVIGLTEDALAMYKPEYVGPVEGRVGRAQEEWTGTVSPESVDFRRTLADIQDLLVRERSGAAVGQKVEYDRLLRLAPNENLPDNVFQSRANSFLRAVRQFRDNRLKVHTTGRAQLREDKPQGTNPPPAGKTEAQMTMTESDIREAMRQTGRTRQEVIDAAKAKGYTIR